MALAGGVMFCNKKKTKRRVEKIVEEQYWNGFIDHASGKKNGLEYASDSGWYSYNEARKIAYNAGWDYAEKIAQWRQDNKKIIWIDKKIPARVYADAYASKRLC